MSFESNNSLLAQVTSEIAKQTTDAVLECISMPFSSDYGNNEYIPFWMNMVQNLSSNTTLHLRMIADLSDPAHRLHICRDLCSFYSLSDPNISVEFYNIDNTFFTYESLLVLKNRLCVITYLDKLLNARNAIITQDAFQTERYYGAVNYLLRGRKPIIETSDFIPLYRRNFFSDFFTGRELFLLTVSLPMFFLKKEMLHAAAENIKNLTEILAMYSYYQKTASRWNICIYKSALTRFLFDGKISILSHTFVLTESERRNYLSQLIHNAKNGCKILLLNDTNPVLDRGNMEFSLFLSSHNMFFIPHENSASEKLHYSVDVNTIHCFHEMLEKLCNLDNSFIIKNPDAIQSFCEDMLY